MPSPELFTQKRLVTMTPRKLTLVEAGGGTPSAEPVKKAAPAKKRAPAKPRTMEHAGKLSRKTALETLRDRIAAAMDDPRAHPRDVGALGKQWLDVVAQLDALAGKKPAVAADADDGPSAVVRTPNAVWDEDAI